MRTPDKLRDLDLDAFAEELARQGYGNKRTTLYDIRNELSEPFKEKRQPFTPISQVREGWELIKHLFLASRVVLAKKKKKPPPLSNLFFSNQLSTINNHFFKSPEF